MDLLIKNRSLFALTLLFVLFSCKTLKNINQESIKIVKIKEHPTLVDHCKQLIIINNSGKEIDQTELYCDPGSGCNSFLFEEKDSFILIDCNGDWFSITKITGNIKYLGWKWQKDLPESLIGYFQYNYKIKSYVLIKSDSAKKEEVYKFKDPKH